MKNVGGPYGGAIIAALFLNEFVGDTPWAHLDIAGPMNADADEGWLSRGRDRLRYPPADPVGARLHRLSRSRTAPANASGASCGTLWPTPLRMRCSYGPVKWARSSGERSAGPKPPSSPSRLIVGTVIVGCAASSSSIGSSVGIARRVAESMPVRVDDDVDEVGVVEHRRGCLERRLVELPRR